jgi:SAM-dependent methyltransferase
MTALDVLNLGAGNNIKGNSVNHDLTRHRPEITAVWDLNKLPWPWPDNSFGRIVAVSVLEHLRLNLVESLDECWRILRPGGEIYMKVPHWQSETAHQDPTHYWYFSLRSFDQFDPDTKRGKEYAFYTARKWRLLPPPPALNKGGSSIIARLAVRK